ncbi:TrbG/VirB9 family P-type conjugative transfer protein [Ralstonia sp.]|uniref:TrbG/VirB9 family P-type conjugative transfer protein n=1 Tax=Ralstonia sp. TaxID=54061 RepID=UPI0031DCF9B5
MKPPHPMWHRLALCAAAGTVALLNTGWAIQRGEQPFDDPHLRSFPYEPDQVYAVQPHVNRFTDFQMAPDERIQEFYLSDKRPSRWRFVVSANHQHVMVKPVVAHADNTVMIITSQRTYQITLLPALTAGNWDQRVSWSNGAAADAAWVAQDARQAARRPTGPTRTATASTGASSINVDYSMSGVAAIRPAAVFDDGHVSRLQFPATLQEMPVVMVSGADGKMTLPNWTVEIAPDGTRTIVVAQLFQKAVLKLGGAQVEIDNHRFPVPPAGPQVR